MSQMIILLGEFYFMPPLSFLPDSFQKRFFRIGRIFGIHKRLINLLVSLNWLKIFDFGFDFR